MRVSQDSLYEVYCDGKRFRSFSAKQTALAYLAACRDLCPDHDWTLHSDVVRYATALDRVCSRTVAPSEEVSGDA